MYNGSYFFSILLINLMDKIMKITKNSENFIENPLNFFKNKFTPKYNILVSNK